MHKPNPENERIKHRYRVHLQDALGRTVDTIDQALAAIDDFESFTRGKPFRKFHIEQARAYSRDLQKRINPKTGKGYGLSTMSGRLLALRKFIEWLCGLTEFRRRINAGDGLYFRLSEADEKIARATRPKRVATVDQVRGAILAMPTTSDIEMRNRAILAFMLATGARIGAVASAPLKIVDAIEGVFHQMAADVKTKRSKSFSSWFLPVGDEVHAVIRDWIVSLRDEKGFGPDDPLFPATARGLGPHRKFEAQGLSRDFWRTTQPIRAVWRKAFSQAGIDISNPHVIRDSLTELGLELCGRGIEFASWSQNTGHNKAMTTWMSYGKVAPERQAAIIRGLGSRRAVTNLAGDPTPEEIARVANYIARTQGKATP